MLPRTGRTAAAVDVPLVLPQLRRGGAGNDGACRVEDARADKRVHNFICMATLNRGNISVLLNADDTSMHTVSLRNQKHMKDVSRMNHRFSEKQTDIGQCHKLINITSHRICHNLLLSARVHC
jgi:hypothetical protein